MLVSLSTHVCNTANVEFVWEIFYYLKHETSNENERRVSSTNGGAVSIWKCMWSKYK